MADVSLSTEGVWSELRANIHAFVGRCVRQPADVDDIVPRVFLQVHRALPTLRDAVHGERAALGPWHADVLAADPVGA